MRVYRIKPVTAVRRLGPGHSGVRQILYYVSPIFKFPF